MIKVTLFILVKVCDSERLWNLTYSVPRAKVCSSAVTFSVSRYCLSIFSFCTPLCTLHYQYLSTKGWESGVGISLPKSVSTNRTLIES